MRVYTITPSVLASFYRLSAKERVGSRYQHSTADDKAFYEEDHAAELEIRAAAGQDEELYARLRHEADEGIFQTVFLGHESKRQRFDLRLADINRRSDLIKYVLRRHQQGEPMLYHKANKLSGELTERQREQANQELEVFLPNMYDPALSSGGGYTDRQLIYYMERDLRRAELRRSHPVGDGWLQTPEVKAYYDSLPEAERAKYANKCEDDVRDDLEFHLKSLAKQAAFEQAKAEHNVTDDDIFNYSAKRITDYWLSFLVPGRDSSAAGLADMADVGDHLGLGDANAAMIKAGAAQRDGTITAQQEHDLREQFAKYFAGQRTHGTNIDMLSCDYHPMYRLADMLAAAGIDTRKAANALPNKALTAFGINGGLTLGSWENTIQLADLPAAVRADLDQGGESTPVPPPRAAVTQTPLAQRKGFDWTFGLGSRK